MTPTPMTLTVTLHLLADRPFDRDEAKDVGRAVAQHVDGTLVGTHTRSDQAERIGWTIGFTAPDAPDALLSQYCIDVSSAARDVLADRQVTAAERDLCLRTGEESALRVDEPKLPEIVGIEEFCEMLGVTRPRIYQLRDEQPDIFPAPVRRGLWLRSMAEAYAENRNKLPGRPSASGAPE